MKKIILLTSMISYPLISFADCKFIILNYTDLAVTAKVGFYGKNDKTFVVKPNVTAIETIKSDYKCNDTTPYATGRAYILFPKDPYLAGANYSPINGVNLMGKSNTTNEGRSLQADNGTLIWLEAPGKPIDDKSFEVVLNFAKRPNNRGASTQ